MSQLYADILVGPTASGKSAVAQFLAQQTPPRPIISADSMAIYRGMDIGTAKPTAAERAAVPSFGFDLAPPDQPFSAGNYLAAIRAAIPAITAAQATPIVVGGTGLYVKALTLGLDPPPSNPELRAQAENILQTHGLPALQGATRALNPAEYAKLRDPENPRRVIRAYELLAAVLDGRLTEETAIRQVTTRTRQYAKRQMTWFRNQADVRWVEVTPRDDTERLANKVRQIWSALGPTRLCP